jgi:L-asparaginase II
VVRALAEEPVAAIGVDGCGAPVHAVSVVGLARAFRAIALASEDVPEGAVATIDGRAVALKIEDGASRARVPVMVAALEGLGVDVPSDLDAAPVFGGGRAVGRVVAVRAWQ